MKYSKINKLLLVLAAALTANAQDFCNNAKHTGKSVTETSNKVGEINGIGYELWSEGGNNSATFYEDGSFSCSFSNSKDYLCRSGLSFDSTKKHSELGHMYADFKLVKKNIQNVDYSYIGVYGWSRSPLVEYYVVDNWLSQWRPGDWVGQKKHGDFVIDGATYTVYEGMRYNAPSIDGNTNFKQFFSIRQQPRECGRIDITAHFEQWEKLGMELGVMHEAKVLGEAGANNGGTTGTADFPYAKVFIEGAEEPEPQPEPQPEPEQGNCSAKILAQGYSCCSPGCTVEFTDDDGTWGIENGEWCGCNEGNSGLSQCSAKILAQGYKCCPANCEIIYTDDDGTWGEYEGEWCGCGEFNSEEPKPECSAKILAQGYSCCSPGCTVEYTDDDGTWGIENGEWCGCNASETPVVVITTTTTTTTTKSPTPTQKIDFCKDSKHTGKSVTETSNKVGEINGIGYELWSEGGNNSATFYEDGSFSCSFSNSKDYLCRSGLSFDSTKKHSELGHMYADFKLVKKNIQNVDYSYIGVYGWSRSPLVEYYVVDNWLSQWRPGDWVGQKKHGDFVIDGATYTVYEGMRYNAPSIDGNTDFKQFFSIRQQPRECGTIDITAHFKQWEKLGMQLGVMHEAKVLGEAGANNGGTTGTADFPYAKVYISN